MLGALIVLLALIAVGHALITTTHWRRAELAVLKTLGFERRQVRATLAWQATALAIVGLVVGIPIGLVLGNLLWSSVASSLGIATTPVFPILALMLCIPCAIAVVIIIGFWPARTVARTWPAAALTVE